MNKDEHLIFVIILFLFTLTFGKQWMEEYLGGRRVENFEPGSMALLSSSMTGGDKAKHEVSKEPFSNKFHQKTNNDQYSTENIKSKKMVIESFVNRIPTKSSSRINMY